MAKTRRGKPASRAKGAKKKSTAKRAKKSTGSRAKMMKAGKQEPAGLDLKKLKADIAKANDILAKRLEGIDPESPQGKKLTASRTTMAQWSVDIDGICTDAEPCGTTMVIS